jgi:hypothetical protein
MERRRGASRAGVVAWQVQPAIGMNGLTSNETRHLRGQKYHHRSNIILRLTAAPQRTHGRRALGEPRILRCQFMERRPHGSWRDGVHADIEAPPFRCGAAGQANDPRLGRVVIAVQPGTDLGIDRVEVDDLAGTARAHMRQSSLHRPPGSPQGGIQSAGQHLVGLILQQHVGRGSEGIVDQNIQAAELRYRQLDGRLDIRLAGHVGLDKQGARSQRLQLLLHRLAAGLVELGDQHRGTRLGKTQRHSSSDTTAGAGDQRHLLLQQLHSEFLLVFW